MTTIYKAPDEPGRGTTVRLVSTNDWNGRLYQRRATDDPHGRDAWFGVGNKGAGTWMYLLQLAGPDGHLELVDADPSRAAAEPAILESVEAWNQRIRNREVDRP